MTLGTIDVHTHFVPQGWPELPGDPGSRPSLAMQSEREALIMVGSKEFRRITSECWDLDERRQAMDADGVDVQVLSPTPVFFSYQQDAADAAAIARIFNDLALELTAEDRDHFVPFCQVPLQDTDAACRELERSIEAGHRGVEIGNHVGDRDLDDAGIVTFLQHCAALDVPVFVHPWDMPSAPRLDRWMAQWLTGMPADTHLSILALILGGAFDQLDPRLRICFAHGGGSFPYWLGRLENAWHFRNDVVGTSAHPPSHYLDRFSVDTVVFDSRALRLLVDTMGVDRVMVGSDYPYPLGERPVGRVVSDSDFLGDRDKSLVRRGNAERFLARAL